MMILEDRQVLERFLLEKQDTKNFVCYGLRKIALPYALYSDLTYLR